MSNSLIQKQYATQKTISFYTNGNLDKLVPDNKNTKVSMILVDSLKELLSGLNSLLYFKNGGYNKGLKVRKIWAKEYCNLEIRQQILDQRIDDQNRNKKYTPVKDIELETDFVTAHIGNWFEVIERATLVFENFVNFDLDLNELSKDIKINLLKSTKADLNFELKKICSKATLPSIIEFLNRTKNKNNSQNDRLNDEVRELAKNILIECKGILDFNLADTINGSRLLRGTFNYNTINKLSKSKEYYDKEILDLKSQLEKKCTGYNDGILNSIGFEINSINTLTLGEASDKLKNFKSSKKKEFNEQIARLISQGYDINSFDTDNINKLYPLFQGKSVDLKEYYDFSVKIQSYSDKKNSCTDLIQKNELAEIIQKLAIDRGGYFREKCKNYKSYCALFKEIRRKEGEIKGEIKNLEADQFESQILTHWSLLVVKSDKINVVLVPKIDRLTLKTNLSKYTQKPSENQIGQYAVVHELKSLTYRALLKQININRDYHGEIAECEGDTQKKDKVTIKYCIN